MEREEVIKRLNEMDCEIANVIVNISGNIESILVYLVKEPSHKDLIKFDQHWLDFDEIEYFERYAKREEMEFIIVEEFVSDYELPED